MRTARSRRGRGRRPQAATERRRTLPRRSAVSFRPLPTLPRALADGRWAPVLLLVLGLATRLPLLSVSLDEVDAANFYNALVYGYNIPWLRPHPPGYPVYVFAAWLLDRLISDPLLTLTLMSALLGSLAAVPFYLLLREMAGPRWALLGGLLFLFNPLVWSFSEAALSDVPGMFAALVVAWLAYRGMEDRRALLLSFLALSLAAGVRQPNAVLGVLPLFALGYRVVALGQRPWRLAAAGAALFAATTAAWFLAAVFVGSQGFGDYFAAVDRQWSTVVAPYDIRQVGSPWLSQALLRTERFVLAYFTMHAWTGSDDKTPLTVALSAPWLFGLVLFVVSFRWRDRRHLYLALWMATILYSVAVIHFLPRYGLPQLPAVIMASMLGFRYLATRLASTPRGVETAGMAAVATLLILFGVKYQPPVGAFESRPPPGAALPALGVATGVALALWTRRRAAQAVAQGGPSPRRGRAWTTAWGVAAALLVAAFALRGYTLASIASREVSPSQRLVTYVKANFDTSQVTPCWDNQTHSFYDAFTPGTQPTGFWSVTALYAQLDRGKTLLISDRCPWFAELEANLNLVPLATFSGRSPLWSKTPYIQLYAAQRRAEAGRPAASPAGLPKP